MVAVVVVQLNGGRARSECRGEGVCMRVRLVFQYLAKLAGAQVMQWADRARRMQGGAGGQELVMTNATNLLSAVHY